MQARPGQDWMRVDKAHSRYSDLTLEDLVRRCGERTHG